MDNNITRERDLVIDCTLIGFVPGRARSRTRLLVAAGPGDGLQRVTGNDPAQFMAGRNGNPSICPGYDGYQFVGDIDLAVHLGAIYPEALISWTKRY